MSSTAGIDYVSKLDVGSVRKGQPASVSRMEEDVDAPFLAVIKAQETSFFALHMVEENDVPQKGAANLRWVDRAYVRATVAVGDALLRAATSQLSLRPGSA